MVLYFLAMTMVFMYSLTMLNLSFHFKKELKSLHKISDEYIQDDKLLPFVTIQLPIYNEKYVVKRLLECISKMDYPKGKLEIQVLDDSTDDSKNDNKKWVEELQLEGFPFVYIHRKNRSGFKAGALKEGLALAHGQYIAIFDADFLPQSDWLKKAISYFKEPQVGIVQTRWGHLNRSYSVLTEIQAFALDIHFTLEQLGRNTLGHFGNFNGTAGIWRKETILDAGNWQADTLTEDLDLSYRAQLKNWKIKYLVDVVAPAELPITVNATRSQQFRWNKGGAENFRKLIKQVLFSSSLNFKGKLHAFIHLLSSSLFLFIFFISLFSVPITILSHHYTALSFLTPIFYVFYAGTFIFFFSYWPSYRYVVGHTFKDFWVYTWKFFTFFTLILGFSFHNAVAVYEGLRGIKSDFVRTPKFNVFKNNVSTPKNEYLIHDIPKIVFWEALLCLYFLFGMIYSAYHLNFGLFVFQSMLLVGYFFVVFNTIVKR